MKKKIDKEMVVMCGLILCFVVCMIYGPIMWKTEKKGYTIAYVYDYRVVNGPALRAEYYYTVNNMKYFGRSGNKGKAFLHKYFIAVFIANRPSISSIEIEKTVTPNALAPQPPEGWDECPINEDGTIKAKYRRRDKNGNIIKSNTTYKKNSKNEEEIDEQALDLIFENRK